MKQKKQYFTPVEIAEILSVSDWSVRNLIKEGKLNAERTGRNYIISQNDLDNYLQSCKASLTPKQKKAVRNILSHYNEIVEYVPAITNDLDILKELS